MPEYRRIIGHADAACDIHSGKGGTDLGSECRLLRLISEDKDVGVRSYRSLLVLEVLAEVSLDLGTVLTILAVST